jgi:uncharacterized repeat protein (TIGR04076 family)
MGARGTSQQPPDQPTVVPLTPRYMFEIEVVDHRNSSCHAHKVGQKYLYPRDLGKICQWLRDSMSGMLRALEWGAVFPWDYEGTKYQKVSDPDGVTTEFVRCPDPTPNGIVVKITRRAVKS